MIFKYLDHLRTKPKEARERVAFLTALGLTLVIGGIWSLTLPARFANTDTLATTEGTRPFAGFINGIKDQWGSIRNQAQTIASTVSTTTASTSDLINLEALLAATSSEPVPTPTPILIGTTSATGTIERE
ncbi:MAG: hypothetical protein MUF19_02290 [Candidatus Pacebacteria bacterium]|jgi:hypothetical protein|nr:hypothetical protein [Candidatus Paceibacterota bacterium]